MFRGIGLYYFMEVLLSTSHYCLQDKTGLYQNTYHVIIITNLHTLSLVLKYRQEMRIHHILLDQKMSKS
jgi:hypothetical protein